MKLVWHSEVRRETCQVWEAAPPRQSRDEDLTGLGGWWRFARRAVKTCQVWEPTPPRQSRDEDLSGLGRWWRFAWRAVKTCQVWEDGYSQQGAL